MKSLRTISAENANIKRLRSSQLTQNDINHATDHHSEHNFFLLEKKLQADSYQISSTMLEYLISRIDGVIKSNNQYAASASLKRIIASSVNRLNHLFSLLALEENNKNFIHEKSKRLIYNLSYLAKSGFDFPPLSDNFIQQFNNCFTHREHGNTSSLMLYSLGILAKYKKFNHPITITLIQELLDSVNHENASNKQNDDINFSLHISNALYGIALLAKENKIKGVITSDSINEIINYFNKITQKENHHTPITVFSLGILAETGILNKKSLDENNLVHLINDIAAVKLNVTASEQTLSGLSRLVRHYDSRLIKHISSKLIHEIARNLISRYHYLYPVTAVNIIDMLSVFTVYHRELNDIFLSLVNAITVSFNRFSPESQAKLNNCLHLLEIHNKDWYNKLHSHLYPKTVIKPTLFIDSSHKQKKIQKSTIANNTNKSGPTTDARKNQIFRIIDDGNIEELKLLLKVKESNPNQRIQLRSVQYESEIDKLFHQKSSHLINQHPNESIVLRFFNEIKTDSFNKLTKKSSHNYFDVLLNACSMHVRYKLIIGHKLHPILLNLSFQQLALFVKKLISPMQIYRDHYAVISLIGALAIRSETDKSNKDGIQELVNELMAKTLCFHQACNHVNVVNRLKRINFKNLVLPDDNVDEAEMSAQTSANKEYANVNYQYDTEDIQAILKARINLILNRSKADQNIYNRLMNGRIHILASAYLSADVPGNGVENILSDFINKNENCDGIALLPIHVNDNHWVGLKIVIRDKKICNMSYYNSMQNENEDIQRCEFIFDAVSKAGLINENGDILGINIVKNCLQQDDFTSCAPCMIENFYCSLINSGWGSGFGLMYRIRTRHLELLHEISPDYYATFTGKQSGNGNDFPSTKTQLISHKVIASSCQGQRLFSSSDRNENASVEEDFTVRNTR